METKFGKEVESGGSIGTPSFWAYNGSKLPFVALLSCAGILGFFGLVGGVKSALVARL